MERPVLREENIAMVLEAITAKMKRHLVERGNGILIGRHELLGAVTEEYHKLVRAVTDNMDGAVRNKLLDLIATCVVGLASYSW